MRYRAFRDDGTVKDDSVKEYGGLVPVWINAVGMMTSSNENIFRVTSHLCGEFTGPQATITWAIVDLDVCCHMAVVGHNESDEG